MMLVNNLRYQQCKMDNLASYVKISQNLLKFLFFSGKQTKSLEAFLTKYTLF